MTPAARVALCALVALPLLACGGGAASDPRTEHASELAADDPATSGSAASGANVFLPGLTCVAPSRPAIGVSLQLVLEDEELELHIGSADAPVDDVIAGLQEVVQAMTGAPGTVQTVMLGGQPGRSLTAVGEDRGQPFSWGIAIARTTDGRELRLSYQTRRTERLRETLEHVMASLTTDADGVAAEGFNRVGVSGYWIETPSDLVLGRASYHYEDESGLEVQLLPPPSGDSSDPVAALTENSVGQARRVSAPVRGELAVAGLTATRLSYQVTVSDDAPYPEEVGTALLEDGRFLLVVGTRWSTASFDEALLTIRVE